MKFHRGAASWVVYEGVSYQVVDRRPGGVLLQMGKFKTWVDANRVYPA